MIVGIIDLCFYIIGIIASSIVVFNLAKRAVRYVFDNWIPYVRVTLSVTDKDGVKKSKAVWLDKRKADDEELLSIIDDVKDGLK